MQVHTRLWCEAGLHFKLVIDLYGLLYPIHFAGLTPFGLFDNIRSRYRGIFWWSLSFPTTTSWQHSSPWFALYDLKLREILWIYFKSLLVYTSEHYEFVCRCREKMVSANKIFRRTQFAIHDRILIFANENKRNIRYDINWRNKFLFSLNIKVWNRNVKKMYGIYFAPQSIRHRL